ncbi:hypothetical protein F5X96DRAFT_48564 [Biscogniauxia mediterranea]|nr:hypothetical protein F5X96DRAFT_48564 [Biscogniauxia mediterranea]
MSRPLSSQPNLEVAENGYITPREDSFVRRASSPNSLDRGLVLEKNSSDPFRGPPNPHSLAMMIANARKDRCGNKVSIRDRICCYQWTWFTMTMVSLLDVLYIYIYIARTTFSTLHPRVGNWRCLQRALFK